MQNIIGVTIAAKDLDAMVEFYNAAFDTGLTQAEGSPIWVGAIGDFEFRLISNDMVGIQAERTLSQLTLQVDDVHAFIDQVTNAGGQPMGEYIESNGSVMWGLTDPDGNSWEIRQRG